MEEIILKINKALVDQGISQTELAKKAGIEQTKVNRLLRGKTIKPDYKVINALIEVLEISGSGKYGDPLKDLFLNKAAEIFEILTEEEKEEEYRRLLNLGADLKARFHKSND